jgi:senataxin
MLSCHLYLSLPSLPAPLLRLVSRSTTDHHLCAYSELRELPEEQHLFCPRLGDDGATYFDEDVAGCPPETDPAELDDRKLKIRDAEERKWSTLKATEILAFDGEEAAPHKEWREGLLHVPG